MQDNTGRPGANSTLEPGSNWQNPSPLPPPPPPGYQPAPPPYGYRPPPSYYYPSYPAPRQQRSGLRLLLGLIALILLIGCILTLLLATFGWEKVGDLRTETQSVPSGPATAANVRVDMGVGDLTVRSGSTDLMTGTFVYNIDSWKPIVEYSTNASNANLTIRQPSGVHPALGNIRYNWDLSFNKDVSLAMWINLGVGKSTLAVDDLSLTRLDVNCGVGDSTVDLSGVRPQNLSVTIKGGVGKTTVSLPTDVGVRVVTNEALGNVRANGLDKNGNVYTNAAYGKSDATITIDLNVGVGAIELR